MPSLRIESGIEATDLVGQVFEFKTKETVIGRDAGCDLCLPSSRISRRHCIITETDGEYSIRDLDSRNGTWVNGVRLPLSPIHDGDLIRLGQTNVRFQAKASVPDASITAGATCDAINFAHTGSEFKAVESLDTAQLPSVLKGVSADGLAAAIQAMLQTARSLNADATDPRMHDGMAECLLALFPNVAEIRILAGAKPDSLEEKARIVKARTPPEADDYVANDLAGDVVGKRRAVLAIGGQGLGSSAQDKTLAGLCSLLGAPLQSGNDVFGAAVLISSSSGQPFSPADLRRFCLACMQMGFYLATVSRGTVVAAERQRVRGLGGFFPPKVAEKIAAGSLQLDGARYTGVVLWGEISGFSPMSEETSPRELIRRVSECSDLLGACILQESGALHESRACAIAGTWGAPDKIGDAATLALRAALRMQNVLVEYNADLSFMGAQPVSARIGLHAGKFVAGDLGMEGRLEYKIIGADVDLARQIQAKASDGMVLASADFCSGLKGRVLGYQYPSVSLRGSVIPVPLICIRGTISKTGPLLSLPVLINRTVAGRAVQASADARRVDIITGMVLDLDTTVTVEWLTPERGTEKTTAVVKESGAPYDHCREFHFATPPSYLAELMSKGLIEGATA